MLNSRFLGYRTNVFAGLWLYLNTRNSLSRLKEPRSRRGQLSTARRVRQEQLHLHIAWKQWKLGAFNEYALERGSDLPGQ